MLFLMPTYSKEFRSLVQSSIFRMEENMVFFMHTDSADVGDGIVWCGSFHNIPFDCVWSINSLQLVDIST